MLKPATGDSDAMEVDPGDAMDVDSEGDRVEQERLRTRAARKEARAQKKAQARVKAEEKKKTAEEKRAARAKAEEKERARIKNEALRARWDVLMRRCRGVPSVFGTSHVA